MLFVVDIGNTEAVFGLYDGDRLTHHWRLSSKVHRTADEYWILFNMWSRTENVSLSRIKGFAVCSVVPALTTVFSELARRHMSLEPLVVSAESETVMTILYDTPRTVGADRICNAVAGFARYQGPLIIVDFGTATSFDVVSEEGEYIGGVIALGVRGASQELHRLAAKLPKVDLTFPPTIVGRTTETSIQSGIMWGSVALVDGMIEGIQHEMQWPRVHVVGTGGIAPIVVERTQKIDVVDPFLTLEGIKLIYQRMTSENIGKI